MKLIDLHCDTLWKLMDLDKTGDFYRSRCAVTIPGMKEAGTIAQFLPALHTLKIIEPEMDMKTRIFMCRR